MVCCIQICTAETEFLFNKLCSSTFRFLWENPRFTHNLNGMCMAEGKSKSIFTYSNDVTREFYIIVVHFLVSLEHGRFF